MTSQHNINKITKITDFLSALSNMFVEKEQTNMMFNEERIEDYVKKVLEEIKEIDNSNFEEEFEKIHEKVHNILKFLYDDETKKADEILHIALDILIRMVDITNRMNELSNTYNLHNLKLRDKYTTKKFIKLTEKKLDFFMRIKVSNDKVKEYRDDVNKYYNDLKKYYFYMLLFGDIPDEIQKKELRFLKSAIYSDDEEDTSSDDEDE